jgi:type VI secretion system secreted protein Hcp
MVDELLEPIPGGNPAGEDLSGNADWNVLQRLRRTAYAATGRQGKTAWAALRHTSAETLRKVSKDLRVGVLWAAANTNLEGFEGLEEGVRLVSGLWSRYARRHGQDHPDDEDLLPFAVESLEVNLLQVSLAESGFTFTTVINSRTDPELASRIQSEVALYRNLWVRLRSTLNAVDAAIQEFQKTVAQQGRTPPAAFNHLSETVADMRRTFSVWAVPEVGTEARPVEPVAPPPSKEPDYAIHLWIDGVAGENGATHHEGWIEGTAYSQAMRRSTASAESPQETFEIEKKLDRSSPALYDAVHTGRVFARVIVDVCRSTDQAERFLRIEMRDARITQVVQSAVSSSERPRPTETISLEYRRIQWTYSKLRQPDAVREGNTSSAWTQPAVPPESRKRHTTRSSPNQSPVQNG